MYPGGAKFLACGHYYNNVVTSKGKKRLIVGAYIDGSCNLLVQLMSSCVSEGIALWHACLLVHLN